MAMNDSGLRLRTIHLKDTAFNRTLALGDGIANVLTGLGGGMDPQSYAYYSVPAISQQQLESSFRVSWLSKKIHTIPPTDAVRAGRSWQADDADIELIEKEEKRLGLWAKVRKAEIFARLYGGSVMLLGTGDGNLALPLDVNRVGKGGLKYIHVFSRPEITIPNLILDPGSEFYSQPTEYLFNGGDGRMIAVHPSRVVRFIGSELPDQVQRAESGWGDPLLMSLQSAITNADTIQGTFSALAAKGKVDVLSVPGLTEMMSTTEGEQRLIKRTQLSQMFSSLFHTLLLDSTPMGKDVAETWEQVTISMANWGEVGTMFMQFVSGASDVPMTRLLGMSPGGLNSTGESDQSNYFQMVSAGQELSLRPRLEMIDEVLLRSALGARPPEAYFSYNPLAVESEEIKSKNFKTRTEGIKTLAESGTVPDEVLQVGTKGMLIESSEMPGIEGAYDEYEAGNLEPLIEVPEEPPIDPLIPLDPATGKPMQNRESRLFAANDVMKRLLADGMPAIEAFNEARRLTDATPRTLYVYRPVLNVAEIAAWAKEQGLPPLQPALHVTVLCSNEPVDWLKMGSSWCDMKGDGSGKMMVTAGGPRVVEPLGDRTAVLMFASTDIQWRHEEMIRAGASHDWPDFIPHISLTGEPVDLRNVVPYRGMIELGPEVFEEIRSIEAA